MHEEDWDRCFNMNVKQHLWLMHAARKHLDETEGAFITTASLAGVNHSGSSLVSSNSTDPPLLPPSTSGFRSCSSLARPPDLTMHHGV